MAAITTSQVEEKLPEKKKTEVENFFKELLSGGNPRVSAMAGSS